MQASLPRRLHASALILGSIVSAAALGIIGGLGSVSLMGAFLYCVTLVASMAYWTFGVPALLVVSTIDGFMKHASDSPGVYLVKDLLLGAISVGMLVHIAFHREYLNRKWYGFLPWLLFFAYMATQIVHPALGPASSIAGFRARAFFGVLYLVGAIYFTRRTRLLSMANLVIALGVVAALSAILQRWMGSAWDRLGPGFALASQHYSSPSGDATLAPSDQLLIRAYGALVDPTALGLFCAFAALFAIAALGRARGRGRLLLLTCAAVILVGLYESGTRSAMVGFGIGLVVVVLFMLTQRGTRAIALIALLFVGMVGTVEFLTHSALSERANGVSIDYALGTRVRSENIVLSDLMRYPLGHGLGASNAGGLVNPTPGVLAVDNIYFAYLYETGPIGLGLFLLVQLTFLTLAVRAIFQRTKYQSVFIGFVAAQCAMLVASLATQGSFDYAPVAQIFWLFCGALALPWRPSDLEPKAATL